MKLKIENLSKTYANGITAFQDISLEISTGMFGLLGPNGAGKSSLMRTLATLQDADSGTMMLGDIDISKNKTEIRKMLGYLPQEFGLYPKISAEMLLHHFAILKGITVASERKERVNALLHKTNLYEVRKQKLGTYSGGMKRRFGIAQALLTDPKLLIVDEPTAGLDPEERNRFYNLLSELSQNTIVILSTHIVNDIEELCSDMAIIKQGKLLVHDRPKHLLDNMKGKVYEKSILSSEIADYSDKYEVISHRLFLGSPLITIWNPPSLDSSWMPVMPKLEHAYFKTLKEG